VRAILAAALALGTAIPGLSQSSIATRPEELAFRELRFDVPDATRYRHVLSNGVVVFVAEDHTFPLVNVGILLRVGSYLEPEGKVGLAALTGSLIRSGGSSRLAPDAFDEEAEFLAAELSSFGGDARAGASLRSITPVLGPAMELFFDMLRRPRFDPDRIALEKSNVLEALRQRNDDAADVLEREWSWLLFGESHYASRRITTAHLDAITRDDLVSFHEKYWRPENMILTVSGDVETKSILEELERHLSDWPGASADVRWPPPLPAHTPEKGVYHVEKDIPQGKVVLGHLVPQWTDWDNPDRAALQVMDFVLGGSGFTSRLVQRIRSDEGLAYGASSDFGFDPTGPGAFTISFESKSETVALAAKIALEEMRRIREEPVSSAELEVAKASLIETFPQRFQSAQQIAGTYAQDAFIGRSHDYWKRWREQVRAVTAEDVQRVAERYLHPDELVFLVVGRWEDIAPGDPGDRASMKELFEGKETRLPLRDPLTLKPLESSP
jgi:predicted Zn-dependent peptidase